MSNDIYSYIKENFGIEITDYQFKRDYIKEPIYIAKNGKGSERPYKEDLEYLYLTLNLRLIDLLKLFLINEGTFLRWLNYFNFKKPQKMISKNIILYYQTNFNCNNCFQLEKTKEKIKNTFKEKYNTEYYSQTNEYKEKFKQTMLKKYNCTAPLQNEELKNKSKATKLERYGDENYTNREKAINTCLKNKQKNNISKQESKWLNENNIPNDRDHRQVKIKYENKIYFVDGYDPETNTIYEFLGDYWHGNPKKFNPNDFNKSCYKTFKELYNETFIRINNLKSLGYNVIFIWESDFNSR